MIIQLSKFPIYDKMDRFFDEVKGPIFYPLPEPARTLSCMFDLVGECLVEAVGPERAAEMLEERWPDFVDEQREIINRLRNLSNT